MGVKTDERGQNFPSHHEPKEYKVLIAFTFDVAEVLTTYVALLVEIQDGWRKERLDSVPALLEKHGVDAWLVGNRLMCRGS